MILVDLSNVLVSTLMVQLGRHTNAEVDESMLRHMALNSLRANRKKFVDEFGELVICCDGPNSWRRSAFPYYKAQRRRHRQNSELDWKKIFDAFDVIKSELNEVFPYKYMHVDTAEADDIIAAICKHEGRQLGGDPILILSCDKDMSQLQKYSNVKQFDPIRKRWIHNSTPEINLMLHIMRGDKGDGIPSIVNSDSSMAEGIRQKPLTSRMIDKWLDIGIENVNEEVHRNWKRNQLLIDFDHIPEDLVNTIIDKYNNSKENGRDKLFNFFIEKKLRNLIEVIGDF